MRALQSNIANTYQALGRKEEAVCLRRDIYSASLRLNGKEHGSTLVDAFNYETSLVTLERYQEAKALLRKTVPIARRVLGEGDICTIRMRNIYALALYEDPVATLDDLREVVTTFEDTERTARHVLGGAHPVTVDIEEHLQESRATLPARATPSPR